MVTLGLFTLVINALMLLVTGCAVAGAGDLGFRVSGFWAAFLGGLVVGLVSVVLSMLLPEQATKRA